MSVRSGRTAALAVATALALVAVGGCGGPSTTSSASHTGTVAYSWGFGATGSLGTGSSAGSPRPQAGVLPAGTSMVAAGKQGLLVLAGSRVLTSETKVPGADSDPAVNDSPSPRLAEVAFPDNAAIKALAVGSDFALAAAEDGAVYSWGANDFGQLGNGATTPTQSVQRVKLPAGVQITALAAGNRYAVALSSAGGVYTWGRGSAGQLGNGATENHATPVTVALPASTKDAVTAIAAGDGHVIALAGGSVLTWGSNGNGQLGTGGGASSDTPNVVPLQHQADSIAAGSAFSVAILSDGSTWSWGSNSDGQLGTGSVTDSRVPVQASVGDVKLRSVSASAKYAIGLRTDGGLLAWGDNADGQLGDTTTRDRHAAVNVSIPSSSKISSVTAGPNGAVALAEPAPLTSLRLTASAAAAASTRVPFTAVASDSLHRSLGPVDPSRLTYRMARGQCDANMCSATEPGLHEVRATVDGVTASAYLAIANTEPTASTPEVFRLPGPDGSHWLRWILLGVATAILVLAAGTAAWFYRRRRGPTVVAASESPEPDERVDS